jgi:scyllo-inositol 2-dehydrogenase (NADP+)
MRSPWGFHAYLLTHEPRFSLAAVASRDPGRRARAEADYPVRTFETLEQMLADGEVDLVILATPHDVHAAQAVAVMDAGKHCVACSSASSTTGGGTATT